MKRLKKGDRFKYADLSNDIYAQSFKGKIFTAKRVTRDGHVYSEENPFPFAWFFLKNIEKVEENELLEACKMRIDEWHKDSRNFKRAEPASLKAMRIAIAKAENKM